MDKSFHDPIHNGVSLAHPPTPAPVYASFSGPSDKAEQDMSMEMDPVPNNDPVLPLSTVAADASQTGDTSIWQALSHQALSNANRGWKAGKTQAEQRQILKDRNREERLRREDKQASKAPKAPKAPRAPRAPKAPKAPKAASAPKGTKPKAKKLLSMRAAAVDAVVKIRGRRAGVSSGRIEKFNARKAGAEAKAKDTARAKGLERAINALDLNTLVKDQQSEPSTQLLMHESYAMTFFPRAADAEKAFKNLQLYYRNPGELSASLSGNAKRQMNILEEEEDRLRSIVRDKGTVEAAIEHQDEKIAEAEELAILRGESEAADRAELHDTQFFQEYYTASMRGKDAATVQDLEAYRRDPSTREQLSKKRQNRLNQALECGRADLNAMGLEKVLTNVKEQYYVPRGSGASQEPRIDSRV
ncbi:MAG: hypothetical protein LQ350_003456 [Teloschistes chrysophthalmus]|nr:MAG: hypothetical protein LQ350_003456 [Niorma chrysophthalma]